MRDKFLAAKTHAPGFSIIELLVVVGIVAILSAMSLPYIYNYQKLYKSDDQSIKLIDLMNEAGQLALTRRRTFRLEIDRTENAIILIDENGTAPAKRVKAIPLEKVSEVRYDAIPTGVARPNPPNYADITFATDTLGHMNGSTSVSGHSVWAARFRSNGSVVNKTDVPMSSTLYLWPPISSGSLTPRNKGEVRAITIFGGSGAIRYWKHNGTTFVPVS